MRLSREDIRRVASWPLLIEAIREGHRGPRADIGDVLTADGENRMLTRAAWVPGVAAGVKAATVVPGNGARGLPSIHAEVLLFSPGDGQLLAALDGTEVTPWKTAADSALGTDLLARPGIEAMAMIGAGTMAWPLVEAHRSVRPTLSKLTVWNRTRERGEALADRARAAGLEARFEPDIAAAVSDADLVSCATMTVEPVLPGEAIRPGTHVDLVGAYRPDMREADDALHERGRWFVDSFDTTLGHIGELSIPLASGTITRDAVLGDLHALVAGEAGRDGEDEITVFKNGGGAHLDVMVSAALVAAMKGAA